MLSGVELAKQRWGGAHSAIDTWLAERQQLLVLYCELAGLPPYQREAQSLPDALKIEAFCEILMDYLSAGHFEIYTQFADDDSELYQRIVPDIMPSTDAALRFNDKYASNNDEKQFSTFDSDLSDLGQQLEVRFELEDELIHSLHTHHL